MALPLICPKAACSRKEQVPGCRQKVTAQALIPPDLPLILPGLQADPPVQDRQVRDHPDPDRPIPADRVPAIPEAAAAPAVILPQAGAAIPSAQVLPHVRWPLPAPGQTSLPVTAAAERPDRLIITDIVMIISFSLFPGPMRKQVPVMKKGFTMRTASAMTTYPLKETAAMKMLSATVRTAIRIPF